MSNRNSGRFIITNIDVDRIKIVSVSMKNETLCVHKAFSVATPEFSFEDGVVKDVGNIVKAMNAAFKANDIKAKSIIFTISSSKVMTKEVTIPKLNGEKRILQHIITNAGEYFPVSTDDCIFSYSLLEQTEVLINDTPQAMIRLMAYAIPNELVNSRYELADQLGLKVMAIDYIGNGIVEVSKRQVTEAPSLSLLINDETTIISMFSGKTLLLQRVVNGGRNMFVQGVAHAYNVSKSEADEMLVNNSLKELVQTKPLIADIVEEFFNNIQRVNEYYKSHFPDKPLEAVYIFGIGSEVQDINEFCEIQLEVPVIMLDRLECIEKVIDVVAEEGEAPAEAETNTDATDILRYVDILGSGFNCLNFISKEREGDALSAARTRTYLIMIGVAAIISAVLIVFPLFDLFTAREDKANVEKQIADMQQALITERVDEIYEAYDIANALRADIMDFENLTHNESENVIELIRFIEVNKPSNMMITSFMCSEDGSLNMSCTADSWDSAAKFILVIKGIPAVSDVSVMGISQLTDADVHSFTFSISANITSKLPITVNSETTK